MSPLDQRVPCRLLVEPEAEQAIEFRDHVIELVVRSNPACRVACSGLGQRVLVARGPGAGWRG
jgi:hypothetical protein